MRIEESESDTDSDSNDICNYSNSARSFDNCIVFQRDSDETSDEEFHLPIDSLPEVNNSTDCDANITCDHILNTNLGRDEIMVFLLGMLKKIKNYLNNLAEEIHRVWLIDKVDLMTTLVAKELQHFEPTNSTQNHEPSEPSVLSTMSSSEPVNDNTNSNELIEHEATDRDTKKQRTKYTNTHRVNNSKQKSKIHSKKPTSRKTAQVEANKPKKSVETRAHNSRKLSVNQNLDTNRQGESANSPEKHDKKIKSQNQIVNRRTSLRLQELTKDKELVYCDKVTYFSLGLPSVLSKPIELVENPFVKRKYTRKTEEERNKLKLEKMSRSLSVAQSKSKTKNKLTKSLVASTSAVTLGNQTFPALNPKGKAKILDVETIDVKNKTRSNNEVNTRPKTKKRRASSLGRNSQKKAKSDDLKRKSYAESSSDQSLIKRKLYSPQEWLLTLQKNTELEGL